MALACPQKLSCTPEARPSQKIVAAAAVDSPQQSGLVGSAAATLRTRWTGCNDACVIGRVFLMTALLSGNKSPSHAFSTGPSPYIQKTSLSSPLRHTSERKAQKQRLQEVGDWSWHTAAAPRVWLSQSFRLLRNVMPVQLKLRDTADAAAPQDVDVLDCGSTGEPCSFCSAGLCAALDQALLRRLALVMRHRPQQNKMQRSAATCRRRACLR